MTAYLVPVVASGAVAAQDRPVVAFAAASLQTALNAIAEDWKRSTGKTIVLSYASSSALARQIENGAPADLFASADVEWMDWAQKRNLIKPETRRTLLGNTLVLVAASGASTDLQISSGFPLSSAIGNSRLATGNVQSVPAGMYAKAALTGLGVWDQVAPKVVGTENVRAALTLVARGEAAYGIVYKTDANAEPKVRVVGQFPEATHPPILYPFALTASSTSSQAQKFLDYLSSPAAISVFNAQGFLTKK